MDIAPINGIHVFARVGHFFFYGHRREIPPAASSLIAVARTGQNHIQPFYIGLMA